MTTPAPLPQDEAARLAALRAYDVLDSPPEEAFEDLVRIAAVACAAPMAVVSFVDADRQWFKAKLGLSARETPRDVAFCAHAILGREPFVVEDAWGDERFATNPLVTSELRIRFYAGAPLLTSAGHALGTLCVYDRVPRNLDPGQRECLQALARQVVSQLELRAAAARLRESEARNHESESGAQSIIDHMLSGLLTFDEDHLIESVNPAAAAIFGYDGEELVGCPLSMVLPDLGASYVERRLQAAEIAAPGSERKGRRKNGEIFRLELSLCHFQSRGRQLLASIVRDLSELDQVDRLKRELASSVDHELRTPLTSIRGSLTLLASGVLGEISAEAGEVIALAERNCLRLIALTSDLLDGAAEPR